MNFLEFELSGGTESSSDKEKEKSTTESKATTKPLENNCADCEKCEKYLEKCNRINRDTLEKLCIESLKTEKTCGYRFKSNLDFCEELFKECGKMMNEGVSLTTLIHFMSTFFDIEEKLRAEIEKADTAKSKI